MQAPAYEEVVFGNSALIFSAVVLMELKQSSSIHTPIESESVIMVQVGHLI